MKTSINPLRKESKYNSILLAILVISSIMATILYCMSVDDILNSSGFSLLKEFLIQSTNPKKTPFFLGKVFDATIITFSYGILGTLASVVLGIIGGIWSSKIWYKAISPHRYFKFKLVRSTIRLVLSVIRSIHEAIWGLILIELLGLNPLVGILAISIAFGAITAKVFSDILDTIDRSSFKALIASGAPAFSAFCYGILPNALSHLISYSFYRFECSIRSSIILGMIGAGGIGYELVLSVRSLQYSEIWTLLYVLIILNSIVMIASRKLQKAVMLGQTKTLFVRFSYFIAIAGVLSSWIYLKPDLAKIFTARTFTLATKLANDSFPPNFSKGWELFQGSWTTFIMALWAILFASYSAFLCSLIQTKAKTMDFDHRISGKIVTNLLAIFILAFRTIPTPVWAILLLFVFFPGIAPGAISLGIYNFSVLARLYSERIGNSDQSSAKALHYSGTNALKIFFYSVFPENRFGVFYYSFYRWEICLRETLVVGLVGAGGLGQILMEELASFNYPRITSILICFFIMTIFLEILSFNIKSDFN